MLVGVTMNSVLTIRIGADMESWRKQDLDKMTSGEVALAVFTAEQDLSESSKKRAEAASKVADIQRELERAQREYNDAAQEENYFYKELSAKVLDTYNKEHFINEHLRIIKAAQEKYPKGFLSDL